MMRDDLENSSLITAIKKLVSFGKQAGFTVDQMIEILNAGTSVEDLLRLIASNLDFEVETPRDFSPWIM